MMEGNATKVYLINSIIDTCEHVLKNNPDDEHTKQCAIEVAYDRIKKIIKEEG